MYYPYNPLAASPNVRRSVASVVPPERENEQRAAGARAAGLGPWQARRTKRGGFGRGLLPRGTMRACLSAHARTLSLLISGALALASVGCSSASTEAEDLASEGDEFRALAAPVDLAQIDGDLLDLQSDASSLYGLVRRTNTYLVERFSKATGAATTLLTTTAQAVNGLAVDESDVYVIREDESNVTSILAASKSGGPTKVISENLPRAHHLQSDATHLYFTSGGKIDRVSKNGGVDSDSCRDKSSATQADGFEAIFVRERRWTSRVSATSRRFLCAAFLTASSELDDPERDELEQRRGGPWASNLTRDLSNCGDSVDMQ